MTYVGSWARNRKAKAIARSLKRFARKYLGFAPRYKKAFVRAQISSEELVQRVLDRKARMREYKGEYTERDEVKARTRECIREYTKRSEVRPWVFARTKAYKAHHEV